MRWQPSGLAAACRCLPLMLHFACMPCCFDLVWFLADKRTCPEWNAFKFVYFRNCIPSFNRVDSATVAEACTHHLDIATALSGEFLINYACDAALLGSRHTVALHQGSTLRPEVLDTWQLFATVSFDFCLQLNVRAADDLVTVRLLLSDDRWCTERRIKTVILLSLDGLLFWMLFYSVQISNAFSATTTDFFYHTLKFQCFQPHTSTAFLHIHTLFMFSGHTFRMLSAIHSQSFLPHMSVVYFSSYLCFWSIVLILFCKFFCAFCSSFYVFLAYAHL